MHEFQFNLSTRSLDRLPPPLLTRGFQPAGEPPAESAEALLLAQELWLKVDFAAA
jgi:hypothetical protein